MLKASEFVWVFLVNATADDMFDRAEERLSMDGLWFR